MFQKEVDVEDLIDVELPLKIVEVDEDQSIPRGKVKK